MCLCCAKGGIKGSSVFHQEVYWVFWTVGMGVEVCCGLGGCFVSEVGSVELVDSVNGTDGLYCVKGLPWCGG